MRRLGLSLAALVVVLDQLLKWWIVTVVMSPPREIEVTSFFNLVMAWNPGISFSLFRSDWAAGPYVWARLAVVVALALGWWLGRVRHALTAIALGLVIGGALGNAIDRLRLGAVADFLDFHWQGWHWPAFNLADSAISVGIVLLVVPGLFGAREGVK